MAFDASDLSAHENFALERTRAGEIADFSTQVGANGVKPCLRAGFLRRLLLQLDEGWIVRAPGVRIRCARIDGRLDLTDCSGAGGAGLAALALLDCEAPDPIDLSHSRLARLSLRGSRLTILTAAQTQIDGELDLREINPFAAPGVKSLIAHLRGVRIDGDLLAQGAKFARSPQSEDDALALQGAEITGDLMLDGIEAIGRVALMRANIAGALSCAGGQLSNGADGAESGEALNGDGATIGALVLNAKFIAEGETSFIGARIAHDVDLGDGAFRNDGAAALNFSNARIGGQIWGLGAKLSGQLLLQGATIARNLELRGADIAHRLRGDSHGRAIDAGGVSVGGALLLGGANFRGEVFLADARIQGNFGLGGGRFINGGGWAIRAPNIRVGGDLTLRIDVGGYAPLGQKTVIEGAAKFDRAQIEGAFAWLNLELRGPGPGNGKEGGAKETLFSFADARIGRALQARSFVAPQGGSIDASGASCTRLDDDIKTGWGAESTRLNLDGFTYARIDAAQECWPARLAWLKRSHRVGEHVSPQPFKHAARIYARAGKREGARRILLAERDLRALRGGPLTWTLSSLFGLIAGYGLAPLRIARALVLFLALGVLGALTMNDQGALVRDDGAACDNAIEPALYAVDVALPVIDFGQASRCAPGQTARADLYPGLRLGEWRVFEGASLWNWAHGLYALLGAMLTALALLTLSGVMKPKPD